jgi:hypothetical protein
MQIRRVVVSGKLALGILAGALVAIAGLSRTTTAFNSPSDPPGFGLVTLVGGQSIRINVVCSEHSVRTQDPPEPCSGELMFHDVEGNTLSARDVTLQPGQAASLEITPFREAGGPIGIDPCWIPGPDNRGHAIPSAEVFSTESGRTMIYLNPVVARLSDLDSAAGMR